MPSPICDNAMSPGTYLRKRRLAAGLSPRDAAIAIATFQGSMRRPVAALIERQLAQVNAAEADRDNLTRTQLAQLAHVFPIDPETYELLLFHRYGAGENLPLPTICAGCGATLAAWMTGSCNRCSDHSETPRPVLTGITDHWPDAPLPEGELP